MLIILFIANLILGIFFGFTGVLCDCYWNDWGLVISSVLAIIFFIFNVLLVRLWINNSTVRFSLQFIVLISLNVILFFFIVMSLMKILSY